MLLQTPDLIPVFIKPHACFCPPDEPFSCFWAESNETGAWWQLVPTGMGDLTPVEYELAHCPVCRGNLRNEDESCHRSHIPETLLLSYALARIISNALLAYAASLHAHKHPKAGECLTLAKMLNPDKPA